MTKLKMQINDFIAKYKSVEVDKLDATEYVKKYIQSYQKEVEFVVQRYLLLLKDVIVSKCYNFLLVDYGGGTGVLSLLAKYIGIKQVVYVDISDEMKNGAYELSRAMNIAVDDFLVWNYEDSAQFKYNNVDVFMNYDVLEHLYKPLEAFIVLKKYLSSNGSIIMGSGANTYNPVLRVLYSQKHGSSEFVGTINGKEIDSKGAFYQIRKDIISENFAELSNIDIKKLAIQTRGYRKDEIIDYCNQYIKDGTLPKRTYLLNTCDPITGNWDEHLIQYYQLQDRLEDYFDEVSISAGLYPEGFIEFESAPDIKDENLMKKMYPLLRYVSVNSGKYLNSVLKVIPNPIKTALSPFYALKVNNPKKEDNSEEALKDIYDNWDEWESDVKALNPDLHYTPNRSLRLLLEFMKQKNLVSPKILDAGCGNGSAALYFEENGFDISAFDISSHAKTVIKNFDQSSLIKTPYEDKSFNLIYSFSVLHHIDNPIVGIKELNRILKKGGYLITTQHTKYSIYTVFRKKILRKIKRFDHLNFIKFNSAETWIERFEEQGFELIEQDGIQFTPIFNLLADALQKYKNPKINIFALIDQFVSKLVPKRIRTERSYHSFLVFRKK